MLLVDTDSAACSLQEGIVSASYMAPEMKLFFSHLSSSSTCFSAGLCGTIQYKPTLQAAGCCRLLRSATPAACAACTAARL